MNQDERTPNADDDLNRSGRPADTGADTEQEAVRKDMSYSPASETETAHKQRDGLPDSVDSDIDADDVHVAPGTGGPDDAGDVEVDPDDLNMPGRN